MHNIFILLRKETNITTANKYFPAICLPSGMIRVKIVTMQRFVKTAHLHSGYTEGFPLF